MKSPNLHQLVKTTLIARPEARSPELFERLQPLFPNDNPVWLRNTINLYRSKFRRRSTKPGSSK